MTQGDEVTHGVAQTAQIVHVHPRGVVQTAPDHHERHAAFLELRGSRVVQMNAQQNRAVGLGVRPLPALGRNHLCVVALAGKAVFQCVAQDAVVRAAAPQIVVQHQPDDVPPAPRQLPCARIGHVAQAGDHALHQRTGFLVDAAAGVQDPRDRAFGDTGFRGDPRDRDF